MGRFICLSWMELILYGLTWKPRSQALTLSCGDFFFWVSTNRTSETPVTNREEQIHLCHL